jgi:hypothetical protein
VICINNKGLHYIVPEIACPGIEGCWSMELLLHTTWMTSWNDAKHLLIWKLFITLTVKDCVVI